MTLFTENPLPVLAVGAILATFAGIVFLSRRTGGALTAFATIVALTLGFLLVERVIVTDREQIESQLDGVMTSIKANDLETVVTYLDPAVPLLRTDAETVLPKIRVKNAGASGVATEVQQNANPPTATTHFRGVLTGTAKQGGAAFGYFDDVDVTWAKRDEKWLITGYTAYLKGQPIDAAGSAKGSRPVTTP